MSQRDRIQMSGAEIEEFLAEQIKVQVATVGRDGTPHLATLFYVLDAGALAFWTYRSSQKVLNLRRTPAMTCLIEAGTGYDELRGVMLTGTGRVVTDPETVARVGAAVGGRMNGLPPDALDLSDPQVRAGVEQAGRKRVAVYAEPVKVASWDHRKL